MSGQLPSRDDCPYCIESRTVSPKMLGCLGHYPGNSSKHLFDREAIDREAAKNAFIAHGADQLHERFSMTAIDHALDKTLDAALGIGETDG